MSSGDEARESEQQVKIPDELPVLPLRDMVVYPFIIAPLSVARELSVQAVDQRGGHGSRGPQPRKLTLRLRRYARRCGRPCA